MATVPAAPGSADPPPGWIRGDGARTALAAALGLTVLAVAYHLGATRGEGLGGSAASFALLAGTALGVLFQRGRFCFYCISRDLFVEKNSRGAFAVLAALAVGTVGYVLIFSLRLPDPSGGRLPAGAHIAPVGPALVLAGIVFGLGVVISGGCIAGHLYRLGEGSVRAVPALLGALVGFGVGFATWNPIYGALIEGAPSPWLPAGGGYGIATVFQLAVLAGIAVVLLRWNPAEPQRDSRRIDGPEIRRQLFFTRWPTLLTGGLVGLVGVAAYLRDQPLGVTSQLSGLTRTVLHERDLLPVTLRGLDERLAGCVALVVDTVTTNGWLVGGIVVGSLAAALPGRRVRWERMSARQGLTAVLGGIMLGWGAVIGLGCTVGVFLSGTQALAVSGWVFAVSVVLALWAGFRLGLHRS
ncbi:YeeE/YedE family protein [Rhodococcus triatomae]|uniref:YeeE/YedE family protein n=1 Tax=Rhodococcus triatomae TaxID=300028 RepID=UPI001473D7A0|nr:YeeE/YedE family protein [Rhodococcus triatomae]QNG17985.1 YeeE/YedE family protein [Rhodococcus triatomae]QNG22347.1 YeeE/YedE family protein [Rhodococcus triatomae]